MTYLGRKNFLASEKYLYNVGQLCTCDRRGGQSRGRQP